ncbi:MAG TPA: hypothetical protein VMT71_12815 [Syntrophorhabdales bacterium]|nr:hypothetical protein [Syntrophorhabdales bacterium]
MNRLLEEIRSIEFTQIHYDEQRKDYFGYSKGHIPILISAPHGVKHYRKSGGEGYWKDEDAYTSSLAIKLGQLTGAHVLFARYKTKEDANSDSVSRYKEFLRKTVRDHTIKFVMDLHGACASRPFKIDIGIMSDTPDGCSCPSLKPIVEKAFRDFEEQVFNKEFAANNCGTITSFARNDLGIEAAQFEINARYRIVQSRSNPTMRANEHDVLDMIARLERLILDIDASLRQK